MNSFFIVISIILNFIALFGIIIIYLRQNRLFDLEKKQEKMVKEMEEVISSYLLEIREDNEEFLDKIKVMNQMRNESSFPNTDNKGEVDYTYIPKVAKINQSSENQNSVSVKPIQIFRSQVVEAYKKNNQIEDTDHIEKLLDQHVDTKPEKKSILQEIISLQSQGFSEEEIAKKLNKGKTEIQLLLKFRQDE